MTSLSGVLDLANNIVNLTKMTKSKARPTMNESATNNAFDCDEEEAPLAVSLEVHSEPSTQITSGKEVIASVDEYKDSPVPATIITGCLGAGKLLYPPRTLQLLVDLAVF